MIQAVTGRLAFLAALCVGCWPAIAQGPLQPVTWTLTANPSDAKPGDALTVDLNAELDSGWHVYGLNQLEGGPTPLKITVDPNSPAQLAGTPSGTPPVKQHDTSFDLDTETFLHPFTLHVPLRLKPNMPPGSQDITLNVRFQACNDHVCLPPKTIHLTASVRVAP
jgi:DsbC/DsbD-like thiol-disulfide interchange protein